MGEGNRQTLRMIQNHIPLEIKEYPSGSQVYDWTIPQEWTIRDAWIKNSNGEKIVDFQKCNVHLVSYSAPVQGTFTFEELSPHLHFREDLAEAIPYRTSYYKRNWGFCLSYNDFKKYFHSGEKYEVFIDSEFTNGSLSIGEILLKGESDEEYLISTYICHPSLANDNLSGPVLTTFLIKELMSMKLKFSYRIIFIPETIGAIAYCSFNESIMKKIKSGMVITTVGGPGKFGYKKTFQDEHVLNAIVENVFQEKGVEDFITYPFDIHGSDERQYSSPGFRINTVTISKDRYYEYDYYHTSLDNLDFVNAEYISQTLELYLSLVTKIDKNIVYKSNYPHCEVMLSKHDLYPEIGGGILPQNSQWNELDIILWLLFYCDGTHDLFTISRLLSIPLEIIFQVALKLEEKKLIDRAKV
jgi:aminopeptidase-like protein